MSVDRRLNPPGDVNNYAQVTGGLVVESSDKTALAKLAELIDDAMSANRPSQSKVNRMRRIVAEQAA